MDEQESDSSRLVYHLNSLRNCRRGLSLNAGAPLPMYSSKACETVSTIPCSIIALAKCGLPRAHLQTSQHLQEECRDLTLSSLPALSFILGNLASLSPTNHSLNSSDAPSGKYANKCHEDGFSSRL